MTLTHYTQTYIKPAGKVPSEDNIEEEDVSDNDQFFLVEDPDKQ